MTKTRLSIKDDKFLINGQLTYSEITDCKHKGLLMNARFIQGIFDDAEDRDRFNRFGRTFDPDKNSNDLIKYMPDWYAAGLRALTIGLQGGGPCFTISNDTIRNNPYSEDGTQIDPAYLKRLDAIIRAADEIGMIIIVSYFYGSQTRFLKDDQAVINIVTNMSGWLKYQGYTNVIIEIANEHNISDFRLPILSQEHGIVRLIEIARKESGGMPVGCSGTGGYYSDAIANASDVILIHGNGQTRNQLYNLIKKAKEVKPARPIVINEDSQALSQMEVTFKSEVSWGYYNNMTKQEPPTDWSITKGDDEFFAMRLKEYLGIEKPDLPLEKQFYLHGPKACETYEGKRFIRIACLYPEKVNYVDFFKNDEFLETAYDDPFSVGFVGNWFQNATLGIKTGDHIKAVIHLVDGNVVTLEEVAE